MTNMIKTPLGQYINKDDILFFNIIRSNEIITKENIKSILNGFVIEVRFKQDIKLTISNTFESYELAADTLKKYIITLE